MSTKITAHVGPKHPSPNDHVHVIELRVELVAPKPVRHPDNPAELQALIADGRAVVARWDLERDGVLPDWEVEDCVESLQGEDDGLFDHLRCDEED